MLSHLEATSRKQERVAAALALIAGYIDAYAYLNYRTYVSFTSGNTTQSASQIGQGNPAALLPLLAIACFVIGAFAGTLLTHSGVRQSRRLLLGFVAVLLAMNTVLTQVGIATAGISIGLLSVGMGMMNTTLSHVGAQSVNLVFVTGTLNSLGRHVALALKHAPLADAQGAWDTHLRRALLLLGIWTAFFTGALVGGYSLAHFGTSVLVVPVVVLVGLAALAPLNS